MNNRITIKGHPADPFDRAVHHISHCWHVYDNGEFVYCGIDWATTLEIARYREWPVPA